jgi:hypothetical protein
LRNLNMESPFLKNERCSLLLEGSGMKLATVG